MSTADDEVRVRADRARQIALWRYQLIREAADPAYSTRQRGRMVRQMAERDQPGPFGTPVRVSRSTLDRWITAWRRGGFDALVPSPRQMQPRTPAEILDMAAALKRENPARTAAQVARILHKHLGWAPSESTVLRHLNRLELTGPPAQSTVFGRFEADRPNELWVGDALHGLVIAGRNLTNIEVRLAGKPMGLAIPHRIGRHAHPKAKPETPEAAPPTSGIGYLKLIDAARNAELANRVNYTALTSPNTTGEDTA